MSRIVFLVTVGLATVLSGVDTVDAQRFGFGYRNNGCSCPTTGQQYYRPAIQPMYQPSYATNYRPRLMQRSIVGPQRVPVQQRMLVAPRSVQAPVMLYQPVAPAQVRTGYQYYPATRCLVPAPYQYRQMTVNPATGAPLNQRPTVAASRATNPSPAEQPNGIQPATFEESVKSPVPPLSSPDETVTSDPIGEVDATAKSVLDRGN